MNHSLPNWTVGSVPFAENGENRGDQRTFDYEKRCANDGVLKEPEAGRMPD